LVFSIDFSPREEKTVYLRVESPEEVFLPMTLWTEQRLYRRILVEVIFTGIYFGILLALTIYNLVLFLRLRQSYLLLYVLYVAVYAGWWFVHAGYYGVSKTLLSLGIHLPIALTSLYIFFRLWFGRSFLGTAEVVPRWNLLLRILQYGIVPLAWLISLFEPRVGRGIVEATANLALFVVALLCVKRGVAQARVYAVAAGLVAFGFLASLLAFNGVVDVPIPLMGLPVLFATLVEVVVLSLALSQHVRTAEAEREHALARAHADRLQTMRGLVAGVVHELNTPVGSLRSGVEALERAAAMLDASGEEQRSDKLTRVKKVLPGLGRTAKAAIDRIGVVLASLKNYSDLDESEVKEVDLHQGLDSALVLLGRDLGDRIAIERSYGEIPPIVCRPAGINHVLMTVLKNAVEAIGQRGTIRIVTETVEGGVRVAIEDDGCGISQQDLARLFSPRLSRKGQRVRMGLGLPTSVGIVEAHGGQLKVDSTPGKGTTVTIELPRRLAD
jgi:signal transduction histidine kinase